MLTGYTNNFPNDVMFDGGIIMIGTAKWGVTKGEPSFNPNREILSSDFDGRTVPLKLLDRIIHGEPEISFTALELGPAATGKQLGYVEPGSTEVTTGVTPNTLTTITPKGGNQFLLAAEYLADFRLIFERGPAVGAGIKKYAALYMPIAIVKSWGPVQGKNKDHPTYQVTVCGRGDPAGALDLPAYKIELRESTP
jgi:hypothetical protein